MIARVRLVVALTLLALLATHLPVLAARGDVPPGPATHRSDTPKPTARPTPRPTPRPRARNQDRERPRPTKRPRASQAPELLEPPAAALAPLRSGLRVGVPSNVLGQAPLLVAQEAGYFADAGFQAVELIPVEDPLADLTGGALDFAVVDAQAALAANAADPTLQAVAGFRNYQGEDGSYGGDMLMAAPGLVADEPGTVAAFLRAYLRGLDRLDGARRSARALALIREGEASLDDAQAGDWPDVVASFAPFDGGFGSVRDEGGWGELGAYLATATATEPDLDALVAEHTLNISQASLGSALNPTGDLAGRPSITRISVGLPAAAGTAGPVSTASDAGYFEDAGFTEVQVSDVEAPLLGLLQGELDFAIIDATDAADGAAQGLPLVALAGHQNHAADGDPDTDVLAVSADFLEQESDTVVAFLTAYVRALQDIEANGADARYAPFDGGFGDRAQGGGLAELSAGLGGTLGADVDLAELIEAEPVQAAQAWYGLPANPTSILTAPSEDASA